MDTPPAPPALVAADERSVVDGAAFGACDKALEAFVARGGVTVTSRQYSISPQWGNVLRAKVAFRDGSVDYPVTCWSKPGEGAEMWVDMQGPLSPQR